MKGGDRKENKVAKVTYKEVIQFFKDSDFELASLVLDFSSKEVEARSEKRSAAAERMAKARAGRGKGKRSKAAVVEAPEIVQPATPAPAPVAQLAGQRAHRVPAPAHTAQATSVESDSVST
jgi:hypothetical protein